MSFACVLELPESELSECCEDTDEAEMIVATGALSLGLLCVKIKDPLLDSIFMQLEVTLLPMEGSGAGTCSSALKITKKMLRRIGGGKLIFVSALLSTAN